MSLLSNPLLLVVYIVSLLTAIGIHEYAHARTADYLGDPTPRLQGRVSLNPLVHIDLAGILFLVFFGFGWGKPVIFDPYNLKNPRRDAALISIAGPVSNIILAIILSLVLRLTGAEFILIPAISLNIMLAVFNLLPVAPLDGFKIVGGILSERRAREWYGLERYGMIFLLLLVIPIGGSSMVQVILRPIMSFALQILLG